MDEDRSRGLVRSLLVAAGSFALMEPITALTHRAVMHGVGRPLHGSHHRHVGPGEREQRWEANDAFPVTFAVVVMLGLAIGFNVPEWDVLVPIGVGVTCYGAADALVHDVYIDHRLRLFGECRPILLERLADQHREHHLHGGAPYGMLLPASARGSRPSHDPLDA